MMRKLLVSLVLWLFFFQPIAAQGTTVYLPLIVKNGECMATLAKLELSDGTTTVNLLTGSGQTGFSLRNWDPAVIQPKGGGVFQDSPMAQGRRLVYAVDATAVEDMTVDINDYDQDGLIAQAQDLMRLLLKARAYQSAEFQDEPIWIRARSNCETNDRYALIINWAIPQLANPYAQPFVSATEISTMDEISLQLERGHWRANRPGIGECAEVSNEQAWDYDFGIAEASDTPTGLVTGFARHVASGDLYATAYDVQILKSTDDGATWANNLTGAPLTAGTVLYGAYTLANDDVLAFGQQGIGAGGIWHTTDNGASWAAIHDALMTVIKDVVQTPSGAVIAVGRRNLAGSPAAIWRSTDDGASWTGVLLAPFFGGDFHSVVITATGDIIAAGLNGNQYISSDDGQNWTQLPPLGGGAVTQVKKLLLGSDGNLYAVAYGSITGATSELWRSTDNGTSWAIRSIINDYITNLIESGGVFYGITTPGASSTFKPQIIKSSDFGATWLNYITVPVTVTDDIGTDGQRHGLFITPANRILAGAGSIPPGAGLIFLTGDVTATTTVGQAATCDNEIFVINKNVTNNLTHIFIDDGGVFTSIFPIAAFPQTLYPAVPAVDDALYFGVETDTGGLFDSLVFDIATVGGGSYTLVYEYWSGAAWTGLTVQDNTASFRVPGVNSVSWARPSGWATTAVNGVTAYWVRIRVSALSGAMTPPTQQNRQIYAVMSAYVSNADVVGDIPAIARIRAQNRSDNLGPGGTLNLYSNRIVAGLKSGRVNFNPYINLVTGEVGVGYSVNLGANTTRVTDPLAPVGARATYNPGGVEAMASRVTVNFGPEIAADFYGTFHAFLRARRTAEAVTDFSIRLQVANGSGGITFTTQSKQLQTTTIFEVLDFGEITMPVSSSFKSTDLGDVTSIAVQASAASATPDLYLYDLILIPVDEWAIDAVDFANTSMSDVGSSNGRQKLLDIDSITNPRMDIRTPVRLASGDFITAEYNCITSGQAILQANVDQRLWFFAMRTSATGSNYSWLSPPEICHSVQLFKNEGYLGQRGNR